jgi:hypothetical protein
VLVLLHPLLDHLFQEVAAVVAVLDFKELAVDRVEVAAEVMAAEPLVLVATELPILAVAVAVVAVVKLEQE